MKGKDVEEEDQGRGRQVGRELEAKVGRPRKSRPALKEVDEIARKEDRGEQDRF